jgi:outer membrane protein OmpA-like peptidoglycan-associated protein
LEKGGKQIMRIRGILLLVLFPLCVGKALEGGASELQIKTARPGSTVTLEKVIADDKVLLSVNGEGGKPVFGLTVKDFVITSGGKNARILSAQTASKSFDVPRNIVLVLDNSLSMIQRSAVEPLLAGVDEIFKTVRPIDKVEVVVFSQKEKKEIAGRELDVRSFSSNQLIDLKNFVADSYSKGATTTTTVLHEAMLAGLELMRSMPENEPRFLVVFSDGEDINSHVGSKEVLQAAEELSGIHAYGIDFMPGAGKDRFLTEFTEENKGETWKATSETNLVPIFQNVASRMEYYYLVGFLFPPSGTIAVSPPNLIVDEVETFDASKTGEAGAKAVNIVRRLDSSPLTLRTSVDTDYGIARWKMTVVNASGVLGTESGEGKPAAEIPIAFKTENLGGLVTGGDIEVSMEVEDAKGQRLELAAEPVKVSRVLTTGSIAVSPAMLTIEEVKTIDSSPMLGYVYFVEGSAEIPSQYDRLARKETSSFDETRFRDTMEKYYQVLNIIGKRLVDHPEATIMLTGCNSNTGLEKGNQQLSAMRASAVRDYLLSVWGIEPERIQTEGRNLPEKPSSNRTEEGKAENRRVEIKSDAPEILAPIRSTYFTTKIDSDVLTLRPTLNAGHGVARWTAAAADRNGTIASFSGEGVPPAEIQLPLGTANLNELATAGDITARMEIVDNKGQKFTMVGIPITVNFIQTSQRLARKQGYQIQEKYALILFDFDSDAISTGNREIVTRIVSRMRELPQATAEIVGYTDNIGKEEYNVKLSVRRAQAVYTLLGSTFGEEAAGRIRHRGVGPNEPLYDNATPEARAFNRTVTITLEYMATGEGT